jgi:hypothetical protein
MTQRGLLDPRPPREQAVEVGIRLPAVSLPKQVLVASEKTLKTVHTLTRKRAADLESVPGGSRRLHLAALALGLRRFADHSVGCDADPLSQKSGGSTSDGGPLTQ